MEKILVIRYGTIGDSIFASAFYRELRNALTEAQIDILADKTSMQVMKNCPYINNIRHIDGKYKNMFNYIKLFKNYDTVYFLKNDSFFTKVAFLAGVKNRIGFEQKRNRFLTKTSPYNGYRHEISCYLDLLKLTEIEVKNTKTEVWITKSDEEKAQEFTADIPYKKVLIQAYSRFPEKNWIDDYWVEVIKELSNGNDIQIYYAGGAKDIILYESLSKNLGKNIKIKPINTCGKLSITETFALINKMDLVIGIDSGLMHAASALDIPSILLHGPTSITRWKPASEDCTVISEDFPCSPCCLQPGTKKYCKHKTPKCMLSLTPKKALRVILKKLSLECAEIIN